MLSETLLFILWYMRYLLFNLFLSGLQIFNYFLYSDAKAAKAHVFFLLTLTA